jgi:hypothetical protein
MVVWSAVAASAAFTAVGAIARLAIRSPGRR